MINIENEYYYELIIKSNNLELIKYVLDDVDGLGIEESNADMHIYSQDDLSNVDFMIKNFCDKVKEKNIDIEYFSIMHKKQNKDWISEYQKNINPLQIGNFYIHTSWQEPQEGFINIQIDPSLAFGTGHHYTTRSIVENLILYVNNGDKLLDIGSGSGILSIVSNYLGAIVDCCDSDEVAIESTKKCFIDNRASFEDCWVGSVNKTNKIYDLVVANIVSDVIICISSDIKKVTKKNSLVLLSGILSKYEDRVLQSFQDFDIIKNQKSNDNEWVTLVLKKQ